MVTAVRLGLWQISPGLRRLAPSTRIVLGGSLLAGTLAISPESLRSVLWIGGTLVVWLLLLRSPIRLVLAITLWSTLLGSTLFLLAVVVDQLEPGAPALSLSAGFAGVLRILLKGSAVTLVALTTLSTLDPAQLREGLTRLRLPFAVAGLVTQILVQSGKLIEETESILRALRLRVPATGGSTAWLLARGVPSIWLPRVMDRAERVADAMTLRGFDARSEMLERTPVRRDDWIAVAVVLLWFGTSLVLLGGNPS